MRVNLPEKMVTTTMTPMFQLNDAVTRLKEEHSILQVVLQEIYSLTCAIRIEKDELQLNNQMYELKKKVADFKVQLDAHSQWEEEELFPMAAWYFGTDIDECTLMEQEHELADQYVKAFTHAIDRTMLPICIEEAKRMTSYLFQAYVILTNHFRDEEELMASLKDHSNSYDY
ncbi:MAG: hemerythrin domain-containing protein [Candidatus Cohnella colombiensis]|uniref:Hemerythrin domain-containing protein n=1 Tax=Candidatus Cohnella colombiensis TaxID=3121368 RepID=A0AA95F5Y8_9BACL|nr:MAG: hemerythrin domain-containing protein [Cohnella sp.]